MQTFTNIIVGQGLTQALKEYDGTMVAVTVLSSHPEIASASVVAGIVSIVGLAIGASIITFTLPSGGIYTEVINVQQPSASVVIGGQVQSVEGLTLVNL